MRITKKKITAIILILSTITGLLFFYAYKYKKADLLMSDATQFQATSNPQSKMTGSSRLQMNDENENDNNKNKNKNNKNKNNKNSYEDNYDKKIALTFDDGPHPYYTEQLLDGLKERGVVATFFVTGEHAILHPDVITRMHEEGHLIGNHTYSHIQLSSSNREEFKEELIATSEVIEEIVGEEVIYVRPPYGTWDKKLEKELNMIPVLWTVDPLDWCSQNVSCITQDVVEKAEENDIILMHDYYDTTVTAALNIVDELLEEGYTFVTVEEILFD